jgi:hypothetical protein
MGQETQPTLAKVIQLLRDLGFVQVLAKKGVLAYTHAESDTVFLFRDRALDTPAHGTELANLRIQLTYRGFLTEQEFRRFLLGLPVATPQQ